VTIEFWHWLALGFGLLVLEMFLPTGFILLWMGIGAVVVGGITWVVPGMGWAAEFVLWGVLSVLAVLAWRRFRPFTLHEPMVNGVGKLRVDDSQWRIAGVDAPAGTQVRVVAVDGATLKVERVD
jgi:inner membrane protein